MKIADIVKEIVKKESGLSHVKVGDVREIVGIISDIIYDDLQATIPKELQHPPKLAVMKALIANGKRRSMKQPEPIKES